MSRKQITAGLRIDVDTLRGTRIGVPNLVVLLDQFGIRATFFFSMGPDNMGRNLWRLLRPDFFLKMMRTKAASLYGWDILFKGTLWPGPVIGKKCADQIRQTASAGHEIGFHAWDHHRWQTQVARMDRDEIVRELNAGMEMLKQITGRYPDCSAAPAWRVTPAVLSAREDFPFRFNSDCRGSSIFYPLMDGKTFSQIQIPATLPTYDEVIGTIPPEQYNDYLLGLIMPDRLNVLTIHAEAEGLSCLGLFTDFLNRARERGISFVPLGRMLDENRSSRTSVITSSTIAGREGWVSQQQEGTS